MKKGIIIIVVIVFLVLLGALLFNSMKKSAVTQSGEFVTETENPIVYVSKNPDVYAKITRYSPGTSTIIQEITIDDEENLDRLKGFVSQIKPLEPEEMVDLALPREIFVEYGDSISINICDGEETYCNYTNKSESIESMAKLPEGMYDWAKGIIK